MTVRVFIPGSRSTEPQAEIAERVDASRTPFSRRASGGFVPLYGTGAEARANRTLPLRISSSFQRRKGSQRVSEPGCSAVIHETFPLQRALVEWALPLRCAVAVVAAGRSV